MGFFDWVGGLFKKYDDRRHALDKEFEEQGIATLTTPIDPAISAASDVLNYPHDLLFGTTDVDWERKCVEGDLNAYWKTQCLQHDLQPRTALDAALTVAGEGAGVVSGRAGRAAEALDKLALHIEREIAEEGSIIERVVVSSRKEDRKSVV